jgi:hypothetical protein
MAWDSLWLMLTFTDLTPASFAASAADPWSYIVISNRVKSGKGKVSLQ